MLQWEGRWGQMWIDKIKGGPNVSRLLYGTFEKSWPGTDPEQKTKFWEPIERINGLEYTQKNMRSRLGM